MVLNESNTSKTLLDLSTNGHKKHHPDNYEELDLLQAEIKGKFKIEFVLQLKKKPNLNFILKIRYWI
jgi:hypothetical protein